MLRCDERRVAVHEAEMKITEYERMRLASVIGNHDMSVYHCASVIIYYVYPASSIAK